MIPFYKSNQISVRNPDALWTDKGVACVDSYQTSVQLCLEVLGTRTVAIPVVLPITASIQTMTAVLRSGGHPILLDIDHKYMQICTNQLQEVFQEFENPVVILNRPCAMKINPALLEMTKLCPTIIDNRFYPVPMSHWLEGTFNVFSCYPALDKGGIVFSKFEEQLKDLRLLRSNFLGHDAELSALEQNHLYDYVTNGKYLIHQKDCSIALDSYRTVFKDKVINTIAFSDEIWFRTEDAKKAQEALASKIETKLPIVPLHTIDALKSRWIEPPDYPVACSLQNKIIALPAHYFTLQLLNELRDIL